MVGVSNNMGLSDDPQLTHECNKFYDVQAYITKCFGRGKEIYFVPYVASKCSLLTCNYNLLF